MARDGCSNGEVHREIAGRLTGRVTKWIVLVGWVVVFVISSGFASKLGDVQNNEASSWLPESAESTQALEALAPFQDANDFATVLVFHRAGGLTPGDLGAIEALNPELGALDGALGDGAGPVPSPDGEVAQSIVTFNFGKNGWAKFPDTADELREMAAIDGVDLYIAGPGGQAADGAEAFAGIDSTLLFSTLGVVIIILLFTYRSPILWVLPIICSVVSLLTSQAVVYWLAKDFGLTVNDQSRGILTVLVIGAGTDYALLLVARYREELRRHEDRHEAMAFALHRATPAIIASAATVAIGMLCLMLAEMNSTSGLGPVNAIGVSVSLIVMITLLPALLVIFGRWIFWPKRPTFDSAEPTASGLWAKVGNAIEPRPRAVWVVTALVLGAACLGIFKLDTSGLPAEDQYTKVFESTTGQRLLLEHGLQDSANPVMVVTDETAQDDVVEALAEVSGLGPAGPPVVKDGVALVTATMPGDFSGQAALDKVGEIRDAVHAADPDALVGGASAILLDIKDASSRDNRVIIPVVLLVVMLILMILLRAVLSPLLLILTVVLSFGAALGLSALLFTEVYTRLFEQGEGFNHGDASFPLYVFVFLVALGIDYNIFLMTRVREETHTRGTRRGSLVALAATGGVITSAGLVLAATFAVLGTLPVVAFVQIGTAVALGVILDTMIVRSVLVTALNLDFGGRIWWPSRLDREPSRPAIADREDVVSR